MIYSYLHICTCNNGYADSVNTFRSIDHIYNNVRSVYKGVVNVSINASWILMLDYLLTHNKKYKYPYENDEPRVIPTGIEFSATRQTDLYARFCTGLIENNFSYKSDQSSINSILGRPINIIRRSTRHLLN